MRETLGVDTAEIEMTVDNRGIPCSLGIFKVMQAMEKMTPGKVLEIISTDRSSKHDLAKWTKRVGHEILAVQEGGNALRPLLRIYVRKKDQAAAG